MITRAHLRIKVFLLLAAFLPSGIVNAQTSNYVTPTPSGSPTPNFAKEFALSAAAVLKDPSVKVLTVRRDPYDIVRADTPLEIWQRKNVKQPAVSDPTKAMRFADLALPADYLYASGLQLFRPILPGASQSVPDSIYVLAPHIARRQLNQVIGNNHELAERNSVTLPGTITGNFLIFIRPARESKDISTDSKMVDYINKLRQDAVLTASNFYELASSSSIFFIDIPLQKYSAPVLSSDDQQFFKMNQIIESVSQYPDLLFVPATLFEEINLVRAQRDRFRTLGCKSTSVNGVTSSFGTSLAAEYCRAINLASSVSTL